MVKFIKREATDCIDYTEKLSEFICVICGKKMPNLEQL